MVKIKLIRMGTKHKPFFRIAVADSRTKLSGKVIERLGFYDPKTAPATLKIDRKKLDDWVLKGAQLTTSLRKLLENEKITPISN